MGSKSFKVYQLGQKKINPLGVQYFDPHHYQNMSNIFQGNILDHHISRTISIIHFMSMCILNKSNKGVCKKKS